MTKEKKAYYMAVRRLLAIMQAAGRPTLEVSLYDDNTDNNANTITEFTNELGVDYDYLLIHRGLIRIRPKA